jgi:hypothetical protein
MKFNVENIGTDKEIKNAVWLNTRDQELLVLMRWIDSMNGWSLEENSPGKRTVIDITPNGYNVNISQSFKPFTGI